MTEILGFCDLNIPASQPNLKQTVLQALKLGYRTLAISVDVSDKIISKNKKDLEKSFPLPTKISITKEDLNKNGISIEPTILSRVTITYSDHASAFLHKAKAAIGKFDIVAFTPLTENAFKHLCQSSMEADIIAFNFEDMEFRLSRKLVQLAIKRDIYIELPYSPCIYSPTNRQKIIKLAYMLREVSKSFNIIITSKAQNESQLRSPLDVANLGLLFRLTPAAAKQSLLSVSWGAVRCAKSRRNGTNKCSAQLKMLDQEPPTKRTKYDSLKAIDKYLK